MMKVAVTRIEPVGTIKILENGQYDVCAVSAEMVAGGQKASRFHGERELVPLGAILEKIDTSAMRWVDPSERSATSHCDARVPALLEELRTPAPRHHEEFRRVLLLRGYSESYFDGQRSLSKIFDPAKCLMIQLRESAGDWPRWIGRGEFLLGDRGFFCMELHPSGHADNGVDAQIQMIDQFVLELGQWCEAWGKRPSPGAASTPFKIVIERTWCEDRGVAQKDCIGFRVEGKAEPFAVRRAVEKAEEDAMFEHYDPMTGKGSWYLVDADSSFKVGDVIAS